MDGLTQGQQQRHGEADFALSSSNIASLMGGSNIDPKLLSSGAKKAVHVKVRNMTFEKL